MCMPVTCPNSRHENEATYVASLTYCNLKFIIWSCFGNLTKPRVASRSESHRGIANAQDTEQDTQLADDRAAPSMKRNVITYVCACAVEILLERYRMAGLTDGEQHEAACDGH
jgi:hypothetical protein